MQRVLNYLKRHEKRFVKELCRYVAFPSVSAQAKHRADLKACADWLVQHCRDLGLKTKLCRTPGNPVVLAQTPRARNSRKPHYLVYGHYDVQPPEPFELWTSPPFKPRIEGKSLYARGSSDNKGQHFAHLKAVEAFLKTGTELPCDITFVVEGEEEVGSESLVGFLKANKRLLKCDGVVVSDNGMPGRNQPALTYGLRGVLAVEFELTGPSRDLHSGIYGGSVDNPAMVLCQMLAQLRDDKGRITIPGFYDDVVELTRYERRQLGRIRGNAEAYRRFLGVPALFGEKGYTPQEQRHSRPTLEINGLTSGYQEQGSKTIVPSKASAKLTSRLVPNQKPRTIRQLIVRHLKAICPPTVKIRIEAGHEGEPYLMSPTGPQAKAALRALKQAFGRDPVLNREGGSIPIVEDFKKQLGVDTLLLGMALPDDNPHSPNEKFDLDCYAKGMKLGAYLWKELGSTRS